jgi:hypothetical protein
MDQWITPTNKRGRLTQDGSSKDSKLAKSSANWINPTTTSNRFSANLGHKASNIWNVKHYLTKQPLFMFFIDLLPAQNNKDIFNV